MDRRYLKNLKRELSDELEQDLYVSDVDIADKLIEQEFLTADDWQSISAIHRPSKKVKQLVKCLGKTGDPFEAYKSLCNLLDISHKHLFPRVKSIIDKYEHIEDKCLSRQRSAPRPTTRVPTENDETIERSADLPNESTAGRISVSCDRSHSLMCPCVHFDTYNRGGNYVNPIPEVSHSNECNCCAACTISSQRSSCDEATSHEQLFMTDTRCTSCDFKQSNINRRTITGASSSLCENTDASSKHDHIADDNDTSSITKLSSQLSLKECQIDENRNHYDYTCGQGVPVTNNCKMVKWVQNQSEDGELSNCEVSDNECNIHVNSLLHVSCDECLPRIIKSLTPECYSTRYKRHTSGQRCSIQYPKDPGSLQSNENQDTSVVLSKRISIQTYEDFRSSSSSFETSDVSSDSELNTDVTEADLIAMEMKLFKEIRNLDGNLSDFVDSLVEKGHLNRDDSSSINKKVCTVKKVAFLAKLLCKPKKVIEHDDRECGSNIAISGVSQQSETDSGGGKNVFYKYPSSTLKDFWKTFDSLNNQVNHGHVDDVTVLPTKSEEACITYFLQACNKLYHNEIDGAEQLIDKANGAAESSRHQLQLKGEVLTAQTWLYLETDRIGKMHSLLDEYEQFLAFIPGIWSPNAYGWFYHDFARCYLRLSTFGSEKHISARKYYKRQAVKCARKAIDCFKASNNSDGPIGIGFAASLVVDALLEATDAIGGKTVDITSEDMSEAENVIQFIELQFNNCMPPILKASYLLNKCCLCLRKHLFKEAKDFAKECRSISEELQLHHNLKILVKITSSINSL